MPAIAHKLIVDEKGQAQELLGADLDGRAEVELREALDDSLRGERSAFVTLDVMPKNHEHR